MDAAELITKLDLLPHPEGGHFRETYRSTQRVRDPANETFIRSAGTSILYLLCAGQISRLHRLASDELWHFYLGGPLCVVQIAPTGELSEQLLGPDLDRGQFLQVVVPAGSWFGARLHGSAPFALVGCTVAPGFEFQDLELGQPERLLERYPEHRQVIVELTLAPSDPGPRSNS